jgi:hypothetical protein
MTQGGGRKGISKYSGVQRLLAAQGGDSLTLTFEQIESAIGTRLPPSAYNRWWWIGRPGPKSYGQQRAWLSAGWRVIDVDFRQRLVTFARLDVPDVRMSTTRS